MPKPKLCFVALHIYPLLNSEYNKLKLIGGAEIQQLMITKELSKRGYEVTFITLNHGQREVENIGPFKVISTYRTEEGKPIIRFFYPRLTRIWSALNKANADIYYVRCAGFMLAPVVLFAKLKRKKVVYCAANEPDFEPDKLNLPVPFRDKMMYLWGLKRCNAYVAQNQAQRCSLLKNFNKKARIIHNGFLKSDNPPNKDGYILWVGNMKVPKNPHIFAELAEKIPNEKFVLVGGISYRSPSKEKERYQNLLDKAGKVSNLEMKGFLPFEEAEKHFGQAKLFVNTSSYEGFPNTFLQAWSRGIPVVSFIDADDLIKKNNLGVVVKDKEEMIQTIKDISTGKIQFSPLRIKEFFEHNLTIEKSVDRYEDLFESLYGKDAECK